MGSVLEHFGHIFGVKNEAAAPKVPQERPKAPTPEIKSRFGSHVGRGCSMILFFLWQAGVLETLLV